MANIDPDLAFDFDAVFQDAAPAAPSWTAARWRRLASARTWKNCTRKTP